MTNNIAKLYELAEIKHKKTYRCPNCGSLTAESGILMFGNKVYRCVRCDFKISVLDLNFKDFTGIDRVVWVRPEFTPKKQLELIKWFLHNTYRNYILFSYRKFEDTGVKAIQYKASSEHIDYFNQDFDQALSGLVIELWNDLTEQQRNEIKEILE